MGAKAVLVGDVADLSEQSVLILVTVTALHFMRMMTLLVLPLFVALVVDNFITVLVRVEFVLLVLLFKMQMGG